MDSSTIHARAITRAPHGKVSFGNCRRSGNVQPPQYRAAPDFSHTGVSIAFVIPNENDPASCAMKATRTINMISRKGSSVTPNSLLASCKLWDGSPMETLAHMKCISMKLM